MMKMFIALIVALFFFILPTASLSSSEEHPLGDGAASAQRFLERGLLLLEGTARAEERGVMRIQNQTPFLVIVYASGVKIGWLRPYRTGVMRGLQNGLHKFFAHTRYGTTAWGPRDMRVPGSWNLTY
jgi:hypothetical protein